MKTIRILPLVLTLAAGAVVPAPLCAGPAETPAPPRAAEAGPAFIGVELMPVDAPTRALFRLPAAGGLLVCGVSPGSPADGTLGQGDIVLKLEDQTIVNRDQLRTLVRARSAGERVAVTVVRGGRAETVRLTLAAAPAAKGAELDRERLPELFREMREHTRRALRDTGHPESLLDATDDVILLSPPAKEAAAPAVAARTLLKPEGSVTVIRRAGKTFVTVKDTEGRTVADGELDAARRAGLPAWARAALDAPADTP